MIVPPSILDLPVITFPLVRAVTLTLTLALILTLTSNHTHIHNHICTCTDTHTHTPLCARRLNVERPHPAFASKL